MLVSANQAFSLIWTDSGGNSISDFKMDRPADTL
jgi:hypothetical protein